MPQQLTLPDLPRTSVATDRVAERLITHAPSTWTDLTPRDSHHRPRLSVVDAFRHDAYRAPLDSRAAYLVRHPYESDKHQTEHASTSTNDSKHTITANNYTDTINTDDNSTKKTDNSNNNVLVAIRSNLSLLCRSDSPSNSFSSTTLVSQVRSSRRCAPRPLMATTTRLTAPESVLHCHRVGLHKSTTTRRTNTSGAAAAAMVGGGMLEVLSDEAEAERAEQRRGEREEKQRRAAEARQRRRDRVFHSASSMRRRRPGASPAETGVAAAESESEKTTVEKIKQKSDTNAVSTSDEAAADDTTLERDEKLDEAHDDEDDANPSPIASPHEAVSHRRQRSSALSKAVTVHRTRTSSNSVLSTPLVTSRFIHHMSDVSHVGTYSSSSSKKNSTLNSTHPSSHSQHLHTARNMGEHTSTHGAGQTGLDASISSRHHTTRASSTRTTSRAEDGCPGEPEPIIDWAESVKERTARFLREMQTHLRHKYVRRGAAAVVIQTAWRAAQAREQRRIRQHSLFAAVFARQAAAAHVLGCHVRRWLCTRHAEQQAERRAGRRAERVCRERALWRQRRAWGVLCRCWRNRCQREKAVWATMRQFRHTHDRHGEVRVTCDVYKDKDEEKMAAVNALKTVHSAIDSSVCTEMCDDNTNTHHSSNNSNTNYDSNDKVKDMLYYHGYDEDDAVVAREHARTLVRVTMALQRRWRNDAPRRRVRWATRRVALMQLMAERQAATVVQRAWRHVQCARALRRAAAQGRMRRACLQRRRAEAVGLIVWMLRRHVTYLHNEEHGSDLYTSTNHITTHNNNNNNNDDDGWTDSQCAKQLADYDAVHRRTTQQQIRHTKSPISHAIHTQHDGSFHSEAQATTSPHTHTVSRLCPNPTKAEEALVQLQRWWRGRLAHDEYRVRRARRRAAAAAAQHDETVRWRAALCITRCVRRWCQQGAHARAWALLAQRLAATLPPLQHVGRGYTARRVALAAQRAQAQARYVRRVAAVRCVQSMLLARAAQRQLIGDRHRRLCEKVALREAGLRLWRVEEAALVVQRVWRRRAQRRAEAWGMRVVCAAVGRVQRWWRGVRARREVREWQSCVRRLQRKREMAEEVMSGLT